VALDLLTRVLLGVYDRHHFGHVLRSLGISDGDRIVCRRHSNRHMRARRLDRVAGQVGLSAFVLNENTFPSQDRRR
jgi:hypothetical protein